ncbi:rhodanese-related sulfurtransferase [Buchnera aphidicola]|uniref:oxygen-dependent tRNA uridine(34) hydroxylase TrhO n=1 Tax=Buchnera aphidicola TaxID=9 RepID=UPI003464A26B
MKKLYNIYSKKKLKLRMLKNSENRITVSFYKYFNIINPLEFRNKIYIIFYKLRIFGRIYISTEGINAQISVFSKLYNFFKKKLYTINENLNNIRLNKSLNKNKSFWFLQVKVRKKIISDGLLENNINFQNTGIYVKPKEVNSMLNDKNTIFVDMRNDYEYVIGHFKNAIHIPGSKFRDQLKILVSFLENYRNKNIVMYCTGGIRCEKATALLKHYSFKNVYHIEGGILNYVYQAKKNNFLIYFEGKIFVFDYRMTENISHHVLSHCKICGTFCDNYINCKNDYCHDLFIQCRFCYNKYQGYCSETCQKL